METLIIAHLGTKLHSNEIENSRTGQGDFERKM